MKHRVRAIKLLHDKQGRKACRRRLGSLNCRLTTANTRGRYRSAVCALLCFCCACELLPLSLSLLDGAVAAYIERLGAEEDQLSLATDG